MFAFLPEPAGEKCPKEGAQENVDDDDDDV
jgi:hypothetical protein